MRNAKDITKSHIVKVLLIATLYHVSFGIYCRLFPLSIFAVPIATIICYSLILVLSIVDDLKQPSDFNYLLQEKAKFPLLNFLLIALLTCITLFSKEIAIFTGSEKVHIAIASSSIAEFILLFYAADF